MDKYTQTALLFDNIGGKKIIADFNGGEVTSDAGLLLLRQLGTGMGLFERAEAGLRDRRHPSYVDHDLRELLTQRVMQIAIGYPFASACDRMRHDPAVKAACGRLPIDGEALGSQPTMSRLENSMSRTDLYRLSLSLGQQFIASYKRAPGSIILDIDDTCDPTHGAQQLSIFNAHDDTYCYRPLHIYEGNSGKLITAILRPGKRPSGAEARSILKRVIGEIRRAWPRVEILVRGDSHFGNDPVMQLCESLKGVDYILGVSQNRVLTRLCEEGFRLQRGYKPQPNYRHYEAFDYAAGSWSRKRRIIARVEVKGESEDVRYIATNRVSCSCAWLYEKVFSRRGRAENWIKDHKNALRSDLTSCHRFVANYLRLLMHSMAYMLMHEFRSRVLRKTELAAAQMDTIRLRVLKIGARVVEKSKVIRFHLPRAWANSPLLCAVYANLSGP